MKNLAIIPARGGSKRIPRKNIRDFLGFPIIKYSIDAAIKSKCFDEVMVSTDDREIAEVAILYGAKIPFMRSDKNSDDKSTLTDVLLEVVGEYKMIGKNFGCICCILPASPLINAKQIKDSFNILKTNNADALIPVVQYGYPIQRAFRIKNDKLKMICPENINKNSQNLELTYHDCGQFYILKTANFLKEKKIFAKKSVPFVMNELQVQDIDNEDDWKIAEFKYKINKNL
ncbi:MAG: pseudaminic acid cytidylyltransferase [Candidatus Berkelbacteria bacterium]|nr:pseudaminic acid cytidylyltransferase [Candidatus Berkelbacteria bacterium]